MWRENKSWQVAFSKQDVHQNILSPHNSFKIKAFWNLDTGRSGAEWADFVIITHKLCSANKKATGGDGGVCVGERGWGGGKQVHYVCPSQEKQMLSLSSLCLPHSLPLCFLAASPSSPLLLLPSQMRVLGRPCSPRWKIHRVRFCPFTHHMKGKETLDAILSAQQKPPLAFVFFPILFLFV